MNITRKLLSAVRQTGVEIVGFSSQPFNGTGTVSLPSGLREDDMVIVLMTAVRSGGSLNATGFFNGTGYSTVLGSTNFTNRPYGGSMQATIGHKFMGSTPDTSITITNGYNSSTTPGIMQIIAIRGVDTSTPFDIGSVPFSTANSNATPNPPNATSVTDGAIYIVSGWSGNFGGSMGTSIMSTTGLDDSLASTVSSGSGINAMSSLFGFFVQDSSGAYDPPAFTNPPAGSGTFSSAGVTIVLRPA